jgi:thioredoxin 1
VFPIDTSNENGQLAWCFVNRTNFLLQHDGLHHVKVSVKRSIPQAGFKLSYIGHLNQSLCSKGVMPLNCSMKKMITLLSLIVMLASCKKDLVDTTANDIPDVTDLASFEQNIAEGVSLVFYHAAWCSKCKEQRPAFEAASNNTESGPAKFFELDYDDYEDIAKKYDVSGFPTMVLYKDGIEVQRFQGTGHSENQLLDAIKAQM